MKLTALNALLLTLLLPLAACGQSSHESASPASAATTSQTTADHEEPSSSLIGGEIRKGIAQAKRELLTQDISLGSVHFGNDTDHHRDTRPKAVITPQGELVIGGKPVAATPEQHSMLLGYRQQLIGIAEAGMDIGASGADIGLSAAKQAVWGAFTGKNEKEIEASIKPQTEHIQAAALALCKRLPDMLTSQQKLAAAMPAFRPYATMQQKDVDECGKETSDKDGKKGFAVFSD